MLNYRLKKLELKLNLLNGNANNANNSSPQNNEEINQLETGSWSLPLASPSFCSNPSETSHRRVLTHNSLTLSFVSLNVRFINMYLHSYLAGFIPIVKHGDLNLPGTEQAIPKTGSIAQSLTVSSQNNPNPIVVQTKNVDARRWSFASMHSTAPNSNNSGSDKANTASNKLDQISIPSDQFR